MITISYPYENKTFFFIQLFCHIYLQAKFFYKQIFLSGLEKMIPVEILQFWAKFEWNKDDDELKSYKFQWLWQGFNSKAPVYNELI